MTTVNLELIFKLAIKVKLKYTHVGGFCVGQWILASIS
jgi:hypothetical protein